jgi:hypothetical protein
MTDWPNRSQCSGHLGAATSTGPGGARRKGAAPSHRRRPLLRTIVVRVAWSAVLGAVIVGVGSVGIAAADVPARAPSASGTSAAPSDTSQGPARRPTSLPSLLVQPRDTTSALDIHLLPNGDQVKGQPTLDLCNQTYPSESLRVQRLQDGATDSSGKTIFSTEAVLYRNAAATKQAFRELSRVAKSCPKGPTPDPENGSTTTTTFHPTPDTDWPQTPSVEREAFSMTTTDADSSSLDSLAVYLRRGRVLLGVYFSKPDGAQPPIDGHTKPADIVSAFATRVAQLPASFVADPAR